MKNCLAIVALLGACSFTDATGCRQVVRVQQVQHAAPVYAAVYQPIAVPVYAYSVGYSADANTALQIENLRLKNEILESRVQQLQQLQQRPLTSPHGEVPLPPPNLEKKKESNEHPGLSYLQRTCVQCHDASVAKAKGGGQAFFDGGVLLKTLTAEQRLAMLTALYSGRMPKGGKAATDTEVAAVINFFDPGAEAASK